MISPSSNMQEDAVTGNTIAQKSTNGAAHVVLTAGVAGGLLVTEDLEPDGVILVRTFLSANNMSAATNPFMHYCDLHHQSTGFGAKQKSPDFYV